MVYLNYCLCLLKIYFNRERKLIFISHLCMYLRPELKWHSPRGSFKFLALNKIIAKIYSCSLCDRHSHCSLERVFLSSLNVCSKILFATNLYYMWEYFLNKTKHLSCCNNSQLGNFKWVKIYYIFQYLCYDKFPKI